MKTIAYNSPFVPAEWLAAHGFRPQWLRPSAAASGLLPAAARGVCPYTAALIDAASAVAEKGTGPICRNGPEGASHKLDLSPFLRLDAAALVLTTACDQMRYAAALLETRSPCPIFLMNVPSTWQTAAVRQLYLDELQRLGRFLARLGGTAPDRDALVRAMLARNERCADWGPVPPSPETATGIPLAVLGGPLMDGDRLLFDIVDRAGGCVVLDATEGAERTVPRPFDPVRVAADPLRELADAYFDGVPDAFRRPNTALYAWLDRQLAARQVRGILFRRYVWCDLWHAELHRLREWTSLPVLEIDVGPDDAGAPGRVQGRIEAFLEMLR